METREDGKKQKAYVASYFSYFHSLSSCKGGGEKEQERAKRRRPSLGRGQERGLLKNEIVSSVRIYLQELNWTTSLHYHTWITHKGHENKGSDLQLKKLYIVKQILRTLRNTQRTVWRACILVRAWRVKASFYLLNSLVSLPLPKEITCTKWSVSTKGTLSRRTPNLLLKLPKIWPKSMWNNCNQNKMQFQKSLFKIGAKSVKISEQNCKLPPTNNESSCWRQCM